MKHGMEGYGIYFAILERMRENRNYIHVKDYNIIAFDLRVPNATIKSVVEDFGLFEFTQDGKHFHSESFTQRMRKIPKYRQSNKRVRMYNYNVKKWYEIIKQVFKRDNYICQYCGKAGGKLEADHIIPFSDGGSDELDNLTTSCRRCNRQKKNKSLEEFKTWQTKRRV
jgi:hypothetical protein